MKANKYFDLEELVPKETFEKYKDNALKFLNPIALIALENVREILNVPLTCNNWKVGGNRNYCGYRQADCPIGAKYSQHKKGNAFDLISPKLTAKQMREILSKNQDKLVYPIRVEKWDNKGEITWLHIDTNYTPKDNSKLYFFKA